MLHPLCMKCIQTCKQENTVKIVRCRKFQKQPSNNDFKSLIDELKSIEEESDKLKNKTRNLVKRAFYKENDVMHNNS